MRSQLYAVCQSHPNHTIGVTSNYKMNCIVEVVKDVAATLRCVQRRSCDAEDDGGDNFLVDGDSDRVREWIVQLDSNPIGGHALRSPLLELQSHIQWRHSCECHVVDLWELDKRIETAKTFVLRLGTDPTPLSVSVCQSGPIAICEWDWPHYTGVVVGGNALVFKHWEVFSLTVMSIDFLYVTTVRHCVANVTVVSYEHSNFRQESSCGIVNVIVVPTRTKDCTTATCPAELTGNRRSEISICSNVAVGARTIGQMMRTDLIKSSWMRFEHNIIATLREIRIAKQIRIKDNVAEECFSIKCLILTNCIETTIKSSRECFTVDCCSEQANCVITSAGYGGCAITVLTIWSR